MDYVVFVLIVLALLAGFYFLHQADVKTKNKYKKEAYRLLDMATAPRDDLIKSIKMLRLYGGRWKKDKEFAQLINRLLDKLEQVESVKS